MRAGIQPLSLQPSHHHCNCCKKLFQNQRPIMAHFEWCWSVKLILHTSELFAIRSKSLKRMNGFFVSNYDWEVSFKLPLSVIFPMTPTHISIWSYFFDHNDIDKILPKAQRPKPMFRVGNQNWLRTPACLAAFLFLGLCFSSLLKDTNYLKIWKKNQIWLRTPECLAAQLFLGQLLFKNINRGSSG